MNGRWRVTNLLSVRSCGIPKTGPRFRTPKVGDFHIAEEITQDIFLRVYEKLQTLKNPNTFAGWLYVIAARQCFAWFEKKRIPMESLDAMPSAELEELAYTQHRAEQQREFVSERQREVVERLLQKLPESERTVVTLHYLDSMTCEDVSEFLGVSPNTVKSRLHRARKRLKKDEPTIREIWGVQGDFIMSDKLKDIRGKFDAYMECMRSDPLSGKDMLMEVNNEIEDALKGEITPELVHLAVDDIYPYMGKFGIEKRLSLLRKYMDDAQMIRSVFGRIRDYTKLTPFVARGPVPRNADLIKRLLIKLIGY